MKYALLICTTVILVVFIHEMAVLQKAEMSENTKMRVLLFREYCKQRAKKIEPKVEIPTEGTLEKL